MGWCFDIFILSKKKNYLFLKTELFKNTLKILLSSLFMSIVLILALKKYSSYLDFTYTYKSIYLLIIIGFASLVYLLSCFLLGLFKIKNYKTN